MDWPESLCQEQRNPEPLLASDSRASGKAPEPRVPSTVGFEQGLSAVAVGLPTDHDRQPRVERRGPDTLFSCTLTVTGPLIRSSMEHLGAVVEEWQWEGEIGVSGSNNWPHHRARGARKREREDKSIQGPYWPNQSAVSHQTVVCYFVPIQHHHQLLCRIKPVQICHSNYSLKLDLG